MVTGMTQTEDLSHELSTLTCILRRCHVAIVQIVGLKGALHTMTVLSGATDHIHGARLGQAGEIEILFEMQSEAPPIDWTA